jgi:hypothetical protein
MSRKRMNPAALCDLCLGALTLSHPPPLLHPHPCLPHSPARGVAPPPPPWPCPFNRMPPHRVVHSEPGPSGGKGGHPAGTMGGWDEVFEGELLCGVPHGHGCYVLSSGFMYEGQFFKGLPHGWGVLCDARYGGNSLHSHHAPPGPARPRPAPPLPKVVCVCHGSSRSNSQTLPVHCWYPTRQGRHVVRGGVCRRGVQRAGHILL